MKFRKDIEGLRAFAILPILLFHAGFESLPGGFVGVDVFFVISGFLITSIIKKEMECSSFSILSFYRKRVLRILPALLVTLILSLFVGSFLLLPTEFTNMTNSAVAAVLFSSNFYFLFNADYFAASAEATPLIHTWSLAVEEQFYIFFPLILMLLHAFYRKYKVYLIAIVVILSFVFSIVLSFFSTEATFYMFPSRAWELGVGALIALNFYPKASVKRSNQLSIFGIALLLLSFFYLESSSFFPAPLAIVPVFATALVVCYASGTFVDNFLSISFFRWIGKISYSLYLCHWPIITFYRLETGFYLDNLESTLLILTCIAVAALSYYLIEKPIIDRFRNSTKASNRIVIGSGITAIVASLCFVIFFFPAINNSNDYSSEVVHVASYIDYRDTNDYKKQFRKGLCFKGQTDDPSVNYDCLQVSEDKENIIVMGDSHAAHFWKAISNRFSDANVIQATASGCRPLINAIGSKRCTELMEVVFKDVIPNNNIDGVFLSGRWKSSELEALIQTVDYLKQYIISEIYVIGPTVEYDGDFPSILARAILSKTEDYTEEFRVLERESLDIYFSEKFKELGLNYISLHEIMCKDNGCIKFDTDGNPYQFDYGHLTLNASTEVVNQFPLSN